MSTSSDERAAIGLGLQLRSLRDSRGLSLRALAREVDVTASFLSQVERGLSSPSLATLRQLAEFYQVPVFQLLTEYEVIRPIVRADERVIIDLPDASMSYEMLSSGASRAIEMFMVRGDTPDANLHRWPAGASEECLFVVSGTLALELRGETHTMSAGDSATYERSTVSSIRSASDEELVFVVAMTPPSR